MLEALEDRIVLTQLAYGLFDTGVDAAGDVLAGGATDPHYTLTTTAQGTAGMGAVVASPLASSWHADTATAGWIAPTADQAAGADAPGSYVYETTFTLGADAAGGGMLSGSISEDNVLTDIKINGVATGYTQANNLAAGVAFQVAGNFIAGTNTIEFLVTNTGTTANSTGIDVENLNVNLAPTVAVAQATVSVPYGGTATDTGTFADPDAGDTVAITSSRETVTQDSAAGTFTFTEADVTAPGPVTITATDSAGNTRTATFAIAESPTATLSGTNAPAARTGGAAVVVNPNLVVADPTGTTLTTATVSIGANFTPSEDRLLYTTTDGIAGSYDATTGILTLTGSATAAQYQAAFRTVEYQDTDTNPVTANRAARGIAFAVAPVIYDAADGHFYQVVTGSGITWADARAAADAMSLYGIKGYLSTLTSAAKSGFVQATSGGFVGWIGGSDAANPGQWKWVDGPDAGLQFWDGTVGGSPVAGAYVNWAADQPDNSGGSELETKVFADGTWDDLQGGALQPSYLVEFGGSTGDAIPAIVATTTVTVGSTTDTPAVTNPAAATLVATPTATITGTADPGSLVQIYVDANDNGTIDAGETVAASEQLAAGQTAYSIAAPLTANAANHFLVAATSGTADRSAAVVVPTITNDLIPPAAPTVTTPAAATAVNATTTTIVGTALAGTLVQIYDDANHDGKVDDGEVVVGTKQLIGDSTLFIIVVPLAANSPNDFLATATDAAGNVSAPAVVPTITADSIPPAAPVITSPTAAVTVGASTDTITGTAEAGSLVRLYDDANNDGKIETGEALVGTVQLAAGQTAFSVPVTLAANTANHFLATATDAAGNVSGVAVVPAITGVIATQGVVYRDLNADGVFDANEPGLPGRVVYLDLAGTGTFTAGDPTATTNADGVFTFAGYAPGTATVREDVSQDALGQYVVDQTATIGAGIVTIGVVPYSPIFPVPVVPNPFTGNSGAGTTAGYVQALYKAVLGRAAGDAEVVAWVGAMDLGTTPFQVASRIINSPEHRTEQVAAMYADFLHRAPDPGSAYWVDRLMAGASEESVAEGILDSPEYQAAHADPTLLVHDLYLDVLGRQGDAGGDAYLESALAAGATPASIVAYIVDSPEANNQIVEGLYAAGLHRPADASSSTYDSFLAAGVPPAVVAASLLSGPEFEQDASNGLAL